MQFLRLKHIIKLPSNFRNLTNYFAEITEREDIFDLLKGDKEQVETCNTRRCTVSGDQISENQYLTEIRDATQNMENECLTVNTVILY